MTRFLACLCTMCFGLAWANSADSAESAQAIPLQYFGLHIHRADKGTAWPSIPFGSWRLWDAYVGWAQLEPSRNQWDFSRLDRYMAMSALTKVDILLPLAMTPQWASARPNEASPYRPGNAAEPARLEDWSNYVSTVGRRYKGKIKHYEIWNEPSDHSHYSGDISTLVRLTCEAKRILKQIDPEIKIVSPASAGGGRHIEYLDQFLRAGGKDCVDIIGHHFYVFKYSPEAMLPLIRQVQAVMAKNGVSKLPLWNTETGWWIANGDGTPDHPMVAKGGWTKLELNHQAGNYLTRALLLARAEGVDRFFWYSWDNPYGFGMIEPTSGKPKPMVETWQTLATELVGATHLACQQSANNGLCTYTRKDGVARDIKWLLD